MCPPDAKPACNLKTVKPILSRCTWVSILEKLDVLRSIDSIIDFSKATVQLRILIALGMGALTITDIVKVTGLRRKAILDAIRKLEIKGLVTRTSDTYMLTRKGREIYNMLMKISMEFNSNGKGLDKNYKVRDAYIDLLSVSYMLECLKILGRRGTKPLPLNKLASKIGLAPTTLEQHLKIYVDNGNITLFERFVGRDGKIYYRLSSMGLKLYNKLYSHRLRSRYTRLVIIAAVFMAIMIFLVITLL